MAQVCSASPLALFGWFDSQGIVNGLGGHWSFGECTLAEAQNGRLLTLRSVAWSPAAMRDDWNAAAAELNSIYHLFWRVFPKNGDLMCVWNQVSHEEIRRGYRRGRLSVAISKDNGLT